MTKCIVIVSHIGDDKFETKLQDALTVAGDGFLTYSQDVSGEGMLTGTVIYNAGLEKA